MKGSDYVAVRRISNRANDTLAAVGESCDRVPENALADLLFYGDIAPKVKATVGFSGAPALMGSEDGSLVTLAPTKPFPLPVKGKE